MSRALVKKIAYLLGAISLAMWLAATLSQDLLTGPFALVAVGCMSVTLLLCVGLLARR